MSTIKACKKEISFDSSDGKNLWQLLIQGGFVTGGACAGKGICGKCLVKIISGSARDESGNKLFGVGDTVRACCVYPVGDIEICSNDCSERNVYSGKAASFEQTTLCENIGLAVDIGTTTVGAYFYDLDNRKMIYSCSACNLQACYGADVLSRLNLISHDPEMLSELQSLIAKQVNLFIKQSGLNKDKIKKIVFVGNTIMEHIAAGINPTPIGEYPYKPDELFNKSYNARKLSIDVCDDAEAYFAPCVSGFMAVILRPVCFFIKKHLMP